MLANLTTTLAATSGTQAGGVAALGIDPWAILAQAVTFLVLLYLLKKFAFDKIVAVLESRRKTIEGSLAEAQQLQEQNQQAEQRVAQVLKEARQQAEAIIATSQSEAGSIIAQAEQAASDKAAQIMAEGERRLQAELDKARTALKQETLALVARATGILLSETIDTKQHERLLARALKESQL